MLTQIITCYNMLHKSMQASCSGMEMLKEAYPKYGKQTMDDMFIDAPRNFLSGNTPANMLRMVPFAQRKIEVPSSSKKPISTAFKEHKFYPEIRPGKGPKHPKTDLDKVFAVSSKIVINEIYKQKKQAKDTKGKIKKSSTITKRSTTPTNVPRAKRPKTTSIPVSLASAQHSSTG